MKRIEHMIEGETIVHYEGALGGDLALCGSDLAGDGTLDITEAKETTKRVTCKHCKAVVAHVRGTGRAS